MADVVVTETPVVVTETPADAAVAASQAATDAAAQASAQAASDAANAAAAADLKAKTEAAAATAALHTVPDAYTLKLPEGAVLEPAVVERTAALSRALGLSNDAGQKLLEAVATEAETVVKAKADATLKAWEAGKGEEWLRRDSEWKAAALKDPEIGGSPEKLAASVQLADRAIATFAEPEVRKFLTDTGIGSNPLIVRMFATIGRKMGEANFITGGQQVAAQPKSYAERMYPQTTDEQK